MLHSRECIKIPGMRLIVIALIVCLAGCTTASVKLSGSYTVQAIAAEEK
jgi:uncharacterized protein YceK